MALPRHALARIEHRDIRLGAARNGDQIGHAARRVLADQPASKLVRVGDGRRQADGLERRHHGPQPGEAERQKMAALGGDERMQFVEHDVAQILEEPPGVGRREKQRKLLGRGQQDVGRLQLLALALVGRRVAGAGLDGDGQAHLADRPGEIAFDVDGERLQRRNVERVDAAMRLPRLALRTVAQVGQAGQEAGQRLAGAGRRNQQHRAAALRLRQKLHLVGARRPAALREPLQERVGQRGGGSRGFGAHLAGHAGDVARGLPAAKRNLEQNGTIDVMTARTRAVTALAAASAPALP